jgi:hypothetical protein
LAAAVIVAFVEPLLTIHAVTEAAGSELEELVLELGAVVVVFLAALGLVLVDEHALSSKAAAAAPAMARPAAFLVSFLVGFGLIMGLILLSYRYFVLQ